MHRRNLIKLLNEYKPISSEENKFKTDMLVFISENKNCFNRSLEIGHITASAWLLNKEGSKVLLMHHAKLNKWLQLGGHTDGESDVLAVAIKEAQEESGIKAIEPISNNIFDIDIHLIPKNSKDNAHLHYDIRFLLQVKSLEDFKINHESKELRWFEKDKNRLPSKSKSITRMYNKWLNL